MIYFLCTPADFRPVPTPGVRWLEREADYALARRYWLDVGQSLKRSTWDAAHEYGYQYAAILEGGQIVALAGAWRFAEECWEVAAVSTLPAFRRRGYARRLVTFVTAFILQSGRSATCSTDDDNRAMAATAESVGFRQVPAAEVWWKFPQLPDF